MTTQTEGDVNYRLLKDKIGQMDLKELLRPHFLQLLEETVHSSLLAKILFDNGAMNQVEYDKFLGKHGTGYQVLYVYQIIIKNNAGEALIDALYRTKNFPILQAVKSRCSCKESIQSQQQQQSDQNSNSNHNNLNIPIEDIKPIVQDDNTINVPETRKETNNLSSSSSTEENLTQVSILKTNKWTAATCYNAWIQLIGEDYLSKIKEDDWHSTLARVVTTNNCGSGDSPIHQTKEFHPQDKIAITKFLEYTLELDLENKTTTRPPREIYINTRSFTSVQWDFLSKVLLLCRDSLEKLWLEGVDYNEYFYGTTWMRNLANNEHPHLRFSKLKSFIFEGNHKNLNDDSLQRILALIKSSSYPLEDLWNKSNCRVQIWTNNFTLCHIMMDPVSRTLFLGSSARAAFKGQVGKLFNPTTVNSHVDPVLLVKLFSIDPQVDWAANGLNGRLLTHLFLRSWLANNIDVFQSVMDNLAHVPLLQKLFLSADHPWKIDLKLLDVLNNLRFVYLRNAKCGGVAVENFPWRKSVQTIILKLCTECALITPGLEKVLPAAVCVMLERNAEQNFLVPTEPFNVSILSTDQLGFKAVREFCSK